MKCSFKIPASGNHIVEDIYAGVVQDWLLHLSRKGYDRTKWGRNTSMEDGHVYDNPILDMILTERLEREWFHTYTARWGESWSVFYARAINFKKNASGYNVHEVLSIHSDGSVFYYSNWADTSDDVAMADALSDMDRSGVQLKDAPEYVKAIFRGLKEEANG
jgi:hypothetical protein